MTMERPFVDCIAVGRFSRVHGAHRDGSAAHRDSAAIEYRRLRTLEDGGISHADGCVVIDLPRLHIDVWNLEAVNICFD